MNGTFDLLKSDLGLNEKKSAYQQNPQETQLTGTGKCYLIKTGYLQTLRKTMSMAQSPRRDAPPGRLYRGHRRGTVAHGAERDARSRLRDRAMRTTLTARTMIASLMQSGFQPQQRRIGSANYTSERVHR